MTYERPAIENRQVIEGFLFDDIWPPGNGGGGRGRGSL